MGPPRAFVDEPTWHGVRVCAMMMLLLLLLSGSHWGERRGDWRFVSVRMAANLLAASRPLKRSTLLYSTLLWTPSKAPLAASMEALFCASLGHTHTWIAHIRGISGGAVAMAHAQSDKHSDANTSEDNTIVCDHLSHLNNIFSVHFIL